MTTKEQLASWIESALEHWAVREEVRIGISYYPNGYFPAGILGLAVIGKGGSPDIALEFYRKALAVIPEEYETRPILACCALLEISAELGEKLTGKHYRGIPAGTIAEMLRQEKL